MATHDIPREQWKTFLDEFTRHHQGACVTVEAVDPRTQPHVEANALPLSAIAFEEKEGGEPSIILRMDGTEGTAPMERTIVNPRHVYHKPGAGVMSSEVNPDEILEITAPGDPPITYIHIRHPGE